MSLDQSTSVECPYCGIAHITPGAGPQYCSNWTTHDLPPISIPDEYIDKIANGSTLVRIAFAGIRRTGKSTYLYCLAYLLLFELGSLVKMDAECNIIGESSLKDLRDILEQYLVKGVPEQTSVNFKEPIIFHLRFPPRLVSPHDSWGEKLDFMLVLQDIAGEVHEPGDGGVKLRENLPAFQNSKHLVPVLVGQYKPDAIGDPLDDFSLMYHALRSRLYGAEFGKQEEKRLYVGLLCADHLWQGSKTGAIFEEWPEDPDPGLRSGKIKKYSDLQNIAERIRVELLRGPGNVASQINAGFPGSKFLTVSALGADPSITGFSDFHPRGVLELLLLILADHAELQEEEHTMTSPTPLHEPIDPESIRTAQTNNLEWILTWAVPIVFACLMLSLLLFHC